LILLKIRRLF